MIVNFYNKYAFFNAAMRIFSLVTGAAASGNKVLVTKTLNDSHAAFSYLRHIT